MRKLFVCSVVSCLGLLVACGGGEDDYQPPGGGIDAAPGIDAPADAPGDVDAGVDGGGIDAPQGGAPPKIEIVSPKAGALVAGVLRIEALVTDADGVETVTATIGPLTITMARETPTSNTWIGNVNTMPLSGFVTPTIIVRAVDESAASSQLGFQIILDNMPPLASLDPPRVRTTRVVDALECSPDFDPLGTDAPDDGEAVAQLIELRARVEDLSNTGTTNSTLFVPYAGVSSVKLYVLDDTARPLVVDSNADGVCDAINPQIVPATIPMVSNEAAVVTLAAIPGTGTAYFVPDTLAGTNATTCIVGVDEDPPPPLCFGELATTVVIDTPVTNQAQIFGIEPAGGVNCLGFAFDARANNIADGWACAAVVVTDALGNRSVSAPLRVCIDSDGNRAECPAWGVISAAGARPSCTGTISGTTVSNTACTPRTFFTPTLADEYELIYP